MASGVAINPLVKKTYEEMKMNKALRYIVFGLSDDLKEIVVKSTADKSKSYEDLVAELHEAREAGQCRYAVMDMPYTKGDVDKSKIIFIAWSPDDAKMKQKMIYASSKDALVRDIDQGITKIQANDDDDLNKKDIVAKLVKDDRYEA